MQSEIINGLFTKSGITIILIILLFSVSVFSQPFTKEEKEILKIQDTRSLVFEQVYDKALEGSKVTKIAAFQYFANVADSNSIEFIELLLEKTSDPEVMITGIFALEQIPCEKSRKLLGDYLSHEIKPGVKASIIEALSRIGNIDDLNSILGITPGNEKINSALAMAIARFGLRKIINDKAFLKLSELMEQSNDSTVRKNVAYAFSRIADKQTLQAYNTELMTLAQSPEPYTRMWAFTGLGKEQENAVLPYILESLEKDIDWRVRVNICNSLGNFKPDPNSNEFNDIITALLRYSSDDPSAHVSIVSLQALGKLAAGIDRNNPLAEKIKNEIQLIITPGKAIDWQIKAEALRTYAKIFKDSVKDELLSLFNQSDNYNIKSAIVESFGFMNDAMVYKELRENVSADVQKYNAAHPNKDGSMIGSPDLAKLYRAFVSALTELDDRMDNENRNTIRLILSEFSSSKDPVLTDMCLANLQDSIYLQYRNETCQVMTFDYNGFEYPKDKDVSLMYIQAWGDMKYEGAKDILTVNLKSNDYDIAKASADALKNITGKSYDNDITANKYRTDFDWDFIDKLGEKQFATIKTNHGNIIIQLNPEVAPFTVQNFVKLSEKGYYNNTIFHRVVPNFVIQGGDPTGTGFGGPGYSIRSEFSPLPFVAYTVGMASSGKDTEGSQFFITHSPQPHLDGKYTVFGSVVDGFDVVDKIQIGDSIESITFSSKY